MSKISSETIEAINDRIDLVSLIENYTHLEKRGSDWWGCCPFHNEKTPSFSVVPDKRMYYCFGCGAGGSSIKFIMEMEKLSFVESVEQLAKKAGIEVVYEGGSYQSAEKDTTREDLFELYERVTGSFHYLLTNSAQGAQGLAYLKSRHVSDAIISQFRLGYAPKERTWLFSFLQKKGYSAEFLQKSGLFSAKYPSTSFFSDRIMFPITNRHGQVIAFGGRIVGGEGPKYLNTSDLPQYKKGENLFGFHLALPEIRKTQSVMLCEGYMDVMAFHQAGITHAVAPLGTALTESQILLIKSFATTVYLSFDSDQAGQNAAYKAIKLCRKSGVSVRVLSIENGKDPADILFNEGSEGLIKLLSSAIIDVEYLIKISFTKFDIGSPEGKANALAFLFPYIEVLDSNIQRESTVARLVDVFGITQKALVSDYKNWNRVDGKPINQVKVLADQQSPRIKLNAELRVVLAVAANPDLFEKMRMQLVPEDFEDVFAKDLFIVLEECYRADANTYDSLLAQCPNENLRDLISKTIIKGEFSANSEKILNDGINLIQQNKLEKKRDNIVGRLRLLQGENGVGTIQLVQELITDKQNIDAKLAILKRNDIDVRSYK